MAGNFFIFQWAVLMKGSKRFWCLLEQVNNFWADLVVWGQFACRLDHTAFPIQPFPYSPSEKSLLLGKPMETCNQFGCQLLDDQLLCKNKVEYIFRVFSFPWHQLCTVSMHGWEMLYSLNAMMLVCNIKHSASEPLLVKKWDSESSFSWCFHSHVSYLHNC